MSSTKLAVVLIRGFVHLSHETKKTLEYLRLNRKHGCVVVEDTLVMRGMLAKVREYTTFGSIDEATFKTLVEKRGKATTDKKVDAAKLAKDFFAGTVKAREFEEKYGVKPFFRLAPPRGGFERKGIKKSVGAGGALGLRDNMSELLLNML